MSVKHALCKMMAEGRVLGLYHVSEVRIGKRDFDRLGAEVCFGVPNGDGPCDDGSIKILTCNGVLKVRP